ncbi:hypothetical protein [Limnospira platensis]|nr:hypothetical protein [Arthrospira platensis NCB002]QQW28733.1 hypothetical protein AP9108_28335 [Arthrospira sp. PCC 9108]
MVRQSLKAFYLPQNYLNLTLLSPGASEFKGFLFTPKLSQSDATIAWCVRV